jgi:two-component system alkaline phosphatase synthesis response regulator PhoP
VERILLVDDDIALVTALRKVLQEEGFEVSSISSGAQAVAITRSFSPNVILLDYMMPDIDGLTVCRQLKADPATNKIPILMVTGNDTDEAAVEALEIGADDYIVKPFSSKVLVAKIKMFLRRKQLPPSEDEISLHNIRIDLRRFHALVDGQDVKLSATEFNILRLLAERPGWVFTRGQMVSQLNGGQHTVTERSIDVQIVGLRKKLGSAGEQIETVRGVGYRVKDL